MTTRGLTPVGRFFFRITGWIGTPFSLIVHTIIFGGILALRFFGVAADYILYIFTTAIAIEVIYLAIFIQLSINKSARTMERMESGLEFIREDEVKTQTILIHLGHQMKTIQHDLDILKKGSLLKTSNGQSKQPIRRAHA